MSVEICLVLGPVRADWTLVERRFATLYGKMSVETALLAVDLPAEVGAEEHFHSRLVGWNIHGYD